jgi:hypothetical protein
MITGKRIALLRHRMDNIMYEIKHGAGRLFSEEDWEGLYLSPIY